MRVRSLLGVCVLLAHAALGLATDPAPPASFKTAVERGKEATVRFLTTANPDEEGDLSIIQDAIRRFSSDLGDGNHLLGSGVLINGEGEIITSRHVVDQVTRLRVRLPNDEDVPATVISTDEASDLALVRIAPPANVTPLSLDGDVTVAVGDWLVVLGNGAGPLPAAAAGILGAKGRLLGLGAGPDMLQLGMSLLPVASGGPILDVNGRLVGIAITSEESVNTAAGIGFGVPVELVRWFVSQVHERGHVVRGWLGLTVQMVTPEIASALRLSASEGALVADVAGGSPAARAGIRRGDVVVRVGDQAVRRANGLPGMVSSLEPGSSVTVTVIRNGRERGIEAVVAPEPIITPRRVSAPPVRGVEGDWGLTLRSATAQELKRLGIVAKGAPVVTAVDEGSAADEGGVEAGDIIIAANREPTTTISALRKALQTGGEHALLQVRRGTASLFVELDR